MLAVDLASRNMLGMSQENWARIRHRTSTIQKYEKGTNRVGASCLWR
jgi:hypothetical protein